MRNLDQGEKRLDALGFRRAIVDSYFRKFRKSANNTTLHPGDSLLHNPAENLWTLDCQRGTKKMCIITIQRNIKVLL